MCGHTECFRESLFFLPTMVPVAARQTMLFIICYSLLSAVSASDDYYGTPSDDGLRAINSESWPVVAPTSANHGRHDGWPAPYPTFPDTNGYSEWPSLSPTLKSDKDPRNTHAPTVTAGGVNPVYLFPTTQYDDTYVISQFNVPTPTPTNIFAERTVNLGIEIWTFAYCVQIVLLLVLWRCWAHCRTNADPFRKADDGGGQFQKVPEENEELTMEEVRHIFARSRDNMQYLTGFGFLTSLFFWAWSFYNVIQLHLVDFGVLTCFLALVSHGIGLSSVGQRMAEKLPPANVRNAYLYKSTVLWAHMSVVASFSITAYSSTAGDHHSKKLYSHSIIMAVIWFLAGLLVFRSANKWCETIEAENMMESMEGGNRKIVNGVLQPGRKRDSQDKPVKEKKSKSATKPFSGTGHTTGKVESSPIPQTKVVRREDFTVLSPEEAVSGDTIFDHVSRNNAFEDEDAAYGLQMGFRQMRQQSDMSDSDVANLDDELPNSRRNSSSRR